VQRSARKWWLESVRDRPSAEAHRRLARSNAQTAVQIETVDGVERAGDGEAWSLDERLLHEAHHNQYGRPWILGRYMFDFLVDSGLRPAHRLCDFGCGALRLGVWAIAYLDDGNYCGIDSHLESLEAATAYEIPLHGLEGKRPRLLWSQDFAFSHFGTEFDWVVDFSSSQKVDPPELPRLFANLVETLAPGGRLLTAPRLSAPLESYAEWGLTLVREVEQDAPTLRGHDFPSTTTWWEFARAYSSRSTV
jgi:SAM-dependent methyltransferase